MHLIPGGAPPPRPRASSRIQSPSVNVRVACTDLLPHQVRAVADAVNPLVADALAFHFKLKSYRWQLTGPRVRECQPLFDEFAAAVLAAADRMADRVRRVGATTVRSAAHASTLQRIPDEHDDVVSIEQMMGRLLADEERLAVSLREAIETCTEHRDHATASGLAAFLDEVERQRWLLFEMVQVGR